MKRQNKKTRATKRQERYITKLAQDIKEFKEREASGEEISVKERKNLRAREVRVMKKMKKEAEPLINEANRVLKLLESEGIITLAQKRVYDEFSKLGKTEFEISRAKTYTDIVKEVTRAKTFLNSSETNILTGSRTERNRGLRKKYASQLDSLTKSMLVN